MGINKETYMAAEAKTEKFDKARKVLDASWKGFWDAIEVITNPEMDAYASVPYFCYLCGAKVTIICESTKKNANFRAKSDIFILF